MKAPFIYGKIVLGNSFTNRKNEINQLIDRFLSGTNTIMISPRRWGKSSLVLMTSERIKQNDKKTQTVLLDLYNIRTEEDFYKRLTEEVLKTTSNTLEDIATHLKQFFKQWVPRISFSADDQNEYKIGLEWQEIKKKPDEVLDLAEKIAKSKNIRIIICIDEFQNISFFEDPLAFQKKLRSHWQRHKSVTYCLYGSKRHMLTEVFSSSSMPFYKFGDIIFLDKIGKKDWIKFIVRQYNDTGKKITNQDAGYIAEMVDCHPYYVQQLAQICWLRSEKETDTPIIEESFESLMLQLSLLFQGLVESLTNTQINFLKALIDKVEHLSSKETIHKYKLGTSANVMIIKKALIKKDIIDDTGHGIFILDPVFGAWLKKYYFNKL